MTTTPLLLERAAKLPAGFLPDPASLSFDPARQISATKNGKAIAPTCTWGEGDDGQLSTKAHEFFGDRDTDRLTLNSLITWGETSTDDD